MAGKYCQLEAGVGYLASVAELDDETARICEEESDTVIDGEFEKWDRSFWSPDSTPPEVRHIALRLASARYLRIVFGETNPDRGDGLQLPRRLENEATERIAKIIGRGWIVGADGEKLPPRDPLEASSMFVRIER